MMAKVNMRDDTAWVVAIDMKHAALEALVPISTERHYTVTMCAPCAFPKYLNNFTADMADQVGKHFKRGTGIEAIKWKYMMSQSKRDGSSVIFKRWSQGIAVLCVSLSG
uniref:Uncharacterized protein n=1 Tax=Aegilops tauschii subsp. strangulata TaxID=200361 RepID=A0A453DWE5_AEGTS